MASQHMQIDRLLCAEYSDLGDNPLIQLENGCFEQGVILFLGLVSASHSGQIIFGKVHDIGAAGTAL